MKKKRRITKDRKEATKTEKWEVKSWNEGKEKYRLIMTVKRKV